MHFRVSMSKTHEWSLCNKFVVVVHWFCFVVLISHEIFLFTRYRSSFYTIVQYNVFYSTFCIQQRLQKCKSILNYYKYLRVTHAILETKYIPLFRLYYSILARLSFASIHQNIKASKFIDETLNSILIKNI